MGQHFNRFINLPLLPLYISFAFTTQQKSRFSIRSTLPSSPPNLPPTLAPPLPLPPPPPSYPHRNPNQPHKQKRPKHAPQKRQKRNRAHMTPQRPRPELPPLVPERTHVWVRDGCQELQRRGVGNTCTCLYVLSAPFTLCFPTYSKYNRKMYKWKGKKGRAGQGLEGREEQRRGKRREANTAGHQLHFPFTVARHLPHSCLDQQRRNHSS